MPCLETIIRNMYLKEDHMSGKSVIVMGKKGVVANKTGSDGITTNDEIYNIRFEDGSISTHPVRDMQMIGESVDRLVEMNPTEHVKKDDETGMYCVYNKDGKKVKEFKDKADADKWATDNHDSLMESSVEHLDEGLVLASDDLNAVKKTAQKLAKQSPDLTYYVVKHNERYMKGMKYAYYEVYQSVDMPTKIVIQRKSLTFSRRRDSVRMHSQIPLFATCSRKTKAMSRRLSQRLRKSIPIISKSPLNWMR